MTENFVLLPGEAADHDGLLIWTSDRSPDVDLPFEVHELHCLKPYCECGFVRFWIRDRAARHADVTLSFRAAGSELVPADSSEDLLPFARQVQSTMNQVLRQNPAHTERVLAGAQAVRAALVNAERFRRRHEPSRERA